MSFGSMFASTAAQVANTATNYAANAVGSVIGGATTAAKGLMNKATGGLASLSGSLSNAPAGVAQLLGPNASVASDALKQAENLTQKIPGGDFLNASNAIGLDNSGGGISAFDPMSGVPLTVITPSTGAGGIPANTIPIERPDKTEEFKVKLSSSPYHGYNTSPGKEYLSDITFLVMPTIQESQGATYDDSTITPLHHPGGIVKYKTTSARTWQISAKLIARDPTEALYNLQAVNTIRSWVMPYYGNGTNKNEDTSRYLGAPPPILTLSAYGKRMIGPVKCVLENFSWTWPDDCDYIPTYSTTDEGDPVPFPVIIQVSLTLKESWSPSEFSSFNLMDYRRGFMPDAFKTATAQEISNSTSQPSSTAQPTDMGEDQRIATDEPQNAKLEASNDGWPGDDTAAKDDAVVSSADTGSPDGLNF